MIRESKDKGITELTVNAEGKAHLARALGIAFSWHDTATHFAVDTTPTEGLSGHWWRAVEEVPRLRLFWHESGARKTAQALPFKLTAERAVEFVWNWLQDVEYPMGPDTDGHASRAWLLTNRHDYDFYSIVEIVPSWVIYGK